MKKNNTLLSPEKSVLENLEKLRLSFSHMLKEYVNPTCHILELIYLIVR